MEELEAMAGLLDVFDEFPECGTDYNSETIGVRHYLGGTRITDQPPAAIIFIFLNGTKHETPIPYAAFITQTIIANIRLGLNGKVHKSIEITASYALMRYRQMTQGQLELENREIPHAAAARARGE
jgi:hypothetical protein